VGAKWRMNQMSDVNNQLLMIELLNKYNDHHVNELEKVHEGQIFVETALTKMDYFLEKLRRLESTAKKDNKSSVELDEEFLENVRDFRENLWGKILDQHEGSLSDNRDPFLYFDGQTMKTDDIPAMQGRLTYIINQQASVLEKFTQKSHRIITTDTQVTTVMTHYNVRDPMIKKCIDGQKTH
jgi:hypothetical protein